MIHHLKSCLHCHVKDESTITYISRDYCNFCLVVYFLEQWIWLCRLQCFHGLIKPEIELYPLYWTLLITQLPQSVLAVLSLTWEPLQACIPCRRITRKRHSQTGKCEETFNRCVARIFFINELSSHILWIMWQWHVQQNTLVYSKFKYYPKSNTNQIAFSCEHFPSVKH